MKDSGLLNRVAELEQEVARIDSERPRRLRGRKQSPRQAIYKFITHEDVVEMANRLSVKPGTIHDDLRFYRNSGRARQLRLYTTYLANKKATEMIRLHDAAQLNMDDFSGRIAREAQDIIYREK